MGCQANEISCNHYLLREFSLEIFLYKAVLTQSCLLSLPTTLDFVIKPGFHISQFIGDLLSGIAEGENDFRNTKDFIHR